MKSHIFNSSVLNSKKGITLIEVLIAIVVLSIGVLGIAILQYMAIGGNSFSREMQIAINLGQGFLEIARSTPFRDASKNINPIFQEGKHPTTVDIAFNPVLQNPIGSGEPNYEPMTRSGGTVFTRIWWVENNCRDLTINDPAPDMPLCEPSPTATCTAGASMNNLSAISVRVCWIDKNGGNHSVTLDGIKWDETATP
ncbi:MAG: type IV pilus modification PilV family protein [Thermodesulfovibrionales bacterium]